MPHQVNAEALARIEYKLDLILEALEIRNSKPMHFVGHRCPACGMSVDHSIDLSKGVVVRKCGCKTGKLPPIGNIIPVPSIETEERNDGRGNEGAAHRGRNLREEG